MTISPEHELVQMPSVCLYAQLIFKSNSLSISQYTFVLVFYANLLCFTSSKTKKPGLKSYF